MKAARECALPRTLVLVSGILWGAAVVGAETLTIHVHDGQTETPLVGAFVMVGSAEGVPFADNIGWTDGSGTVVFEHPLLAQPQTLTAGMEGFGLTTLYESALGELTLALYPARPDRTMGGLRTIVRGDVTGVETVSNDGNFDAAVVVPALDAGSFALADKIGFIILPDTTNFPIIGDLPMLSNIYLPDQVEFLFFHFEKGPYRIDLPGDQTQTFVAVHARVAIDDILGGTFLETAEILEVGVERDVLVTSPGPQTVDIECDLALSPDLTVELVDVPAGALVQAASGALIPSAGRELMVAYDTRGTVPLRRQLFELATMAPAGDLSDALNIAVGTYIDSSAARTYTVGIFDRSGFVPPHEIQFDSWMRVPELTQMGHRLTWEDPTNPGVSPPPTWSRSNLGLRAIDAQDTSVVQTVDWRVYAAAAPLLLRLPLLPESAPGPLGGLPDPSQTPEEDQLYWEFVAANPTGDISAVLQDFLQGGTHWVSHWIPLEWDPTGVAGDPPAVTHLRLRAAPNPACAEIRLAWRSRWPGTGQIEIVAADGRRVWQELVPLESGERIWRGRTADGPPAAAGVYWANLRLGATLLARQRLIWLR